MKLLAVRILLFVVTASFTMKACCGVIIKDDEYTNSKYGGVSTNYQQSNEQDDYIDTDYYDSDGKRRHRRRKKPCPTNKIAPDGKTLVNIYYSDVHVAESTHNYHGESGGVYQDNYGSTGCGPGIVTPNGNQGFGGHRPNRPLGLIHNNNNNGNRPGLLQFLNNVLFGESYTPVDNSVLSSTSENDIVSTGPLGGTVPDKIRVTSYNNDQIRRAYRAFNRELDSFLRPFYRLF